MKYIIEPSKNLTTPKMEQRLGLNSGDITEMTISPDGTVEIEISEVIAASLKADAEQSQRDLDELMSLADDKITVSQIGRFLKALIKLRR